MDKPNLHFSAWDYVVFIACLLLSLLIGLKYALTGGKQRTTDEFLMASRKMRYGPVALSLMVTFISAVTVLGVPAEIFLHGTDYCFLVVSYFLCFPVVAHVFIPVFYRLKITSVYEYLELRFSKAVRTVSTVTYMLMLIIYMGVVLYTPALALNTVTNVNVWASVVTLCVVCTIYTTLGGLKAVIWTDVFQAIVMLGGQIVVLAIGATKVGGIENAWKIGVNAGKVSMIRFDPSPFERHTFWTLGIGGAFMCLSLYGTSQTAVQRYLSCGTLKDAQMQSVLYSKVIVVGYGVLCLIMSAVASLLGSVLIAAISIFGIIGGPLLGLFFLGFFFQSANAIGAMAGFASGLIFSSVVGFGSIAYYIINVPSPVYELRDSECAVEFNTTGFNMDVTASYTPISVMNTTTPEPFTHSNIKDSFAGLYQGASFVYKLSYLWYGGLSVAVVLTVGLFVSCCTGQYSNGEVDEDTLHPIVKRGKGTGFMKYCCYSECLSRKQHYTVSIELSEKNARSNSILLHPNEI